VVPFVEVFLPKFFKYLCPAHYHPSSLHRHSYSIWREVNYEAPHYVLFSSIFVTSLVFGPNIFLSTLFSDTLSATIINLFHIIYRLSS
jgi:hypothetical protein